RGGGPEQVEEHVDEEQASPKARHGHTADAEKAARVVERRIAVDRGQYAERDAEEHRDGETRERQFQRGGDAPPGVLPDRPGPRRALARGPRAAAGATTPLTHPP